MNRLAALPVFGTALLAACTTTPDELASPSFAAGSAPVAPLVAAAELRADPLPEDVVTIEAEASDTNVVCETKRRPGSRIGATVCYTREERAALDQTQAEAARQYARDLDRERAMREQQRPLETQERAIIAFQ